MSYSGVATVAIGLVMLAVAVAVAAGVLLCLRRRRRAERLLPVFLGLLAAALVVSILAVRDGQHDLQRQAQRTLVLTSAAERASLSRFGHYTTSVANLKRLNSGLAVELKVDGAAVRILRGPGTGTVTLWASLGPGTEAQALLRSDGRLEEIDARSASAKSQRGQAPSDSRRHPS
jgi:4-amino-4-deoxy-L-arabinose transferase-like glycosyltransferase